MKEGIDLKSIEIVQDMNKAISVMYDAGKWLLDSGRNPNKYWLPENMNREFLSKHVDPDQFYVALVKGEPAASIILQEDERNQSWKSVDGETSQTALYIHWLAVKRDFAGKGLSQVLIEFAIEQAKKRGHSRVRWDTNANEPKLRKIYDDYGKAVHIEKEDYQDTVFYQIDLN